MRRVALVVPTFPKLSETFIVSKVIGLLERGWDVHVVCGSSDRSALRQLAQEQPGSLFSRVHTTLPYRPRWLAGLLTPLTLICCFFANPNGVQHYLRRGWRLFGVDILRRFYLDAELIALRPDLVHFEFGTLAVGRMYLKELLGSTVVVSFRGYDLNYVGLDDPEYYREIWERSDALHVLGRDLWLRAQRRGCPSDRSHALIAPAIDTEFFNFGERSHAEVVGTPDRPLRILSVGRLEWKKGYEYALQAVKLLVDRGVQCEYHIVGAGEYLESVAFARHQLGLEQVVSLRGAQSRSETRAQMGWADVLLHAAVSEGFCNAVVEAQAMALPVICTDADGLPENIVDGTTGFLAPRRDPYALADKLLLLAHDPALRQRLGQAGAQRARTNFRLEDQMAAFEQLYNCTLSGRNKAGDVRLAHYSAESNAQPAQQVYGLANDEHAS